MDLEEVWKDVPDYPGYKVSSLGQIFSNKLKRIINTRLSKIGYVRCNLQKDTIRYTQLVHRIVGITFIPNPENKATINHIDGNKTNNNISNLEWNSYKENYDHSAKILGVQGHLLPHPRKSITLTKDGIDYPFERMIDMYAFLNCSGKSFKRLQAGLKNNINGFKIKTSII